jgi:DNA-binding transcriptional ArsR family regulator
LALDLAATLRRKITFQYSPIIEMLISLHVLHDPERQGVLLPWMVRFREKVSPDLMRELRHFGGHYNRWLDAAADVLRNEGAQDLSVAGFIERLTALEPTAFVGRLLGGKVDADLIRRILAGEASVDAIGLSVEVDTLETRQALQELFADVPGVKARLSALLDGYWTAYFRDEFYWIELLLVRSIREAVIELEREDPGSLLVRLSRGALGMDGEILATSSSGSPASGWSADGLDRIYLLPSVFLYPETLVVGGPRRVVASYPVSPGVYLRRETLNPPQNLSLLLKVLADDTRLKILKLTAERRRFTQELAGELDLAEPTVSRHLKLLREVELIAGEKEGNYIYYSLRLERLADLQTRLLDFFRT